MAFSSFCLLQHSMTSHQSRWSFTEVRTFPLIKLSVAWAKLILFVELAPTNSGCSWRLRISSLVATCKKSYSNPTIVKWRLSRICLQNSWWSRSVRICWSVAHSNTWMLLKMSRRIIWRHCRNLMMLSTRRSGFWPRKTNSSRLIRWKYRTKTSRSDNCSISK